ncbi:hypothetical protein AB0M43_07680 [Longispora sp. NPDC051575]|uniref:hypothetical protein n=1 Tax=Longispora sp. NPDC051575 TaxID=3154943 RepID=UPI003443CC94
MSGSETAGLIGEQRWRADWVPVDRRLLGIDRRTLLPAGLVVALFLIAAWILPAVNDAVKVSDPIRAGDVVQVGSGVLFTPMAGANLITGLRQGDAGPTGSYPATAAVSYQGVVFEIVTDTYQGTPAQLLEQIRKTDEGLRGAAGGFRVTGAPVTVSTATGQQGVAARVEGVNMVGLVAAFVFGGTGVEVEVIGPQAVSASVAPDIAAMLRSVRPVDGSGS